MHQYKFTLDGNDIYPTNLDSFSRILDISDGRVRRVEYSGTLQFCDEAYETVRDTYFFFSLTNLCAEFELTVEYRENQHDAWTNFGNAVLDAGSIEFDFKTKTATMSFNATDNIKKIDQNGGTEFTIDRDEGELLTLFEYESGTDYTGTNRFFQVSTVINELFDKMGTGSTLDSDVFTTDYQPKIEEIACPAIAENDLFRVRVGFLSQYCIDVTLTGKAGGYTATEVAEEVEKLLQYAVHTETLTAIRAIYSLCVSRTTNTLTLTHNVGVLDTEITLNGGDVTGTYLTNLQSYQFGLQNLYISAKGMRDTDLEISFNQLWTWLWRQFNFGMAATSSTTIEIDDLADMVIGSTPASVVRDNVESFTRKLDTEFLKKTVAVGSKFKISNYDKSQEDWVWADPDTDHIYVGLVASQTYDFNVVPDNLIRDDETAPFSDNGNRWGVFQYGADRDLNTQFQIDLNLQAGNVASETGNYIEVHINAVLHETLNLPAISSSIPTPVRVTTSNLCLNAADVVLFKIGNAAGTWSVTDYPSYGSINPVASITTLIQPSCETSPEIDEQEYEIDAKVADLSISCDGELDRQTESSIYSGLGYAISQQIQGLQDYENTYFMIMKNPLSAKAYKFESCFYYPEDPNCDCQDDNFFSRFFYNIPIQYHQNAYLNARTLGRPLSSALYIRIVTFSLPAYTLNESVLKEDTHDEIIGDYDTITFESDLSPSELKTIESEFTVGFDLGNFIIPFTYNKRYKKVEFELKTGNTRFELRAQRI